ncbi:hypothetical protein MTBBW1_2730004 [Desulfamplus magnetovallimortis]|uniref:Uncharacterized protein n=1 Tax=Desulfamplus magnetovallimortis TaxID=1246637 RepID=A0A1W1HF64_9BACT|nr:hypothetical protein MTBBW1_2730004 [Desulfamplus magnetovallimortis]
MYFCEQKSLVKSSISVLTFDEITSIDNIQKQVFAILWITY